MGLKTYDGLEFHSWYMSLMCVGKVMGGVWSLDQTPSVACWMFCFMVRKCAGMAVDLGCWIPRPPCLVLIDAIRIACSGVAPLLVKAPSN